MVYNSIQTTLVYNVLKSLFMCILIEHFKTKQAQPASWYTQLLPPVTSPLLLQQRKCTEAPATAVYKARWTVSSVIYGWRHDQTKLWT